jgi:CheY-like chemotaxis protein
MLLMPQTPSSSLISNSVTKGQLSLNGLRILVVDDDRNTLEMLSELLSSYNADVRTAESVTTALILYRSWAPEILLSDLGMPEQDGYDLIRNIHALPYGLLRKAIAITGFCRDEDRERALAAGYDNFLTKPVEFGQLISLIAEINRP